MSIMLTEMGVRTGLLLLAMVLSFVGSAVARSLTDGRDTATLAGALAGLTVGLVLYAIVIRRFNARPKPQPTTGTSTH